MKDLGISQSRFSFLIELQVLGAGVVEQRDQGRRRSHSPVGGRVSVL